MATCGGLKAQPASQPSGKATFVSRDQAGGIVSTSVRIVLEPAEAKLGAHRPGLGGKGLWWAGSRPLASPLPHVPALLPGVLPFSPTTLQTPIYCRHYGPSPESHVPHFPAADLFPAHHHLPAGSPLGWGVSSLSRALPGPPSHQQESIPWAGAQA